MEQKRLAKWRTKTNNPSIRLENHVERVIETLKNHTHAEPYVVLYDSVTYSLSSVMSSYD